MGVGVGVGVGACVGVGTGFNEGKTVATITGVVVDIGAGETAGAAVGPPHDATAKVNRTVKTAKIIGLNLTHRY